MSAILVLARRPAWCELPERLRERGAAVTVVTGPLGFEQPARADLGEFDALVTLPPQVVLEPLIELPPAEWIEHFRSWVEEPFILLRDWLRRRLDRCAPGRFVAVTSHLGLQALPSAGAAGTCAASLHTLVRVAALEYGGRGIRANAVALGWHDRSMPDRLGADGVELALRDTPSGRFTNDHDLERTVWWLLAEASEQLNGQVLTLDGGYTISRGAAAAPSIEAASWLLDDEWRV